MRRLPISGCGPTLVVRLNSAEDSPRHLLLYGHLDTVEPLEGWRRDPFRPALIGGRMFGLGACDMKGGLAAIMLAASRLQGLSLPGSLTLAFASDEELLSRGCDALVKSGLLKGVTGAVSAEPTGLDRLEVGRRGRIVYEVEVKGRARHAALPDPGGVDAVAAASKLVLRLKRLPLGRRMGVRGSVAVLALEGGTEFLTIPDACRLKIDRHLVPGETPARALAQLRRLADNLSLEEVKFRVRLLRRPTPFMKPYVVDRGCPLVACVREAARRRLGFLPKVKLGLSVADDNYLAARAKIPTVTLGPGGGNYHAPNEYVNLGSVAEAANIYALAAQLYLNSS